MEAGRGQRSAMTNVLVGRQCCRWVPAERREMGEVPGPAGTVGNLVCGAIVKPQEAGYGDQEGHFGRAFVGRDPQEEICKNGYFDELKQALAERFLNAELDYHLDGQAAAGKANHRNGYSKK